MLKGKDIFGASRDISKKVLLTLADISQTTYTIVVDQSTPQPLAPLRRLFEPQ